MTEDVEEMWGRQAAAEERYSTPYLDLTREDVVAFAHGAPSRVAPGTVFPSRLLLGAAGKRVLCLASAGGQQTVLFTLAGARVTVLDISAGQLAADQRAAAHYGYALDAVKGDMRDLSMFADESFDLIYQPISACFIPDLLPLYREAFVSSGAVGATKSPTATRPRMPFRSRAATAGGTGRATVSLSPTAAVSSAWTRAGARTCAKARRRVSTCTS